MGLSIKYVGLSVSPLACAACSLTPLWDDCDCVVLVAVCGRELFAPDEAAGKRCAYLSQDPSAWMRLVQEANVLVRASQEQSTVALVYKEAVDADIVRLRSHTQARGEGDLPSQEELVTAVATLNQVQAKLTSLRVRASPRWLCGLLAAVLNSA